MKDHRDLAVRLVEINKVANNSGANFTENFMSNVFELYTKRIKENKVKAFIAELKDRGFNICDCRECLSSQKDIVNLSYKIADHIDRPNELNEADHQAVIDNFALNIGSCILRPAFLIGLGKWESDESANLVNCDATNYMIFLYDLICDYSHLMNESERKKFSKNIELIRPLFPGEDCYNNAA